MFPHSRISTNKCRMRKIENHHLANIPVIVSGKKSAINAKISGENGIKTGYLESLKVLFCKILKSK